jgi:hypothetical protein
MGCNLKISKLNHQLAWMEQTFILPMLQESIMNVTNLVWCGVIVKLFTFAQPCQCMESLTWS